MILTGKEHIQPFSPDGFYGTLDADSNSDIRVAAVALNSDNEVVLLSLTGFDTAVSGTLSKLWLKETATITPTEGSGWDGMTFIRRIVGTSYKTIQTDLRGTREKHFLAFPYSAHIADGVNSPPDIPSEVVEAKKEEAKAAAAAGASDDAAAAEEPKKQKINLKGEIPPRYVFANWDDDTPNPRAFLGALVGLRVLVLRDKDMPDVVDTWLDELWQRGCAQGLITPLTALGIKAWELSGSILAWNNLILEGVQEGWLPTTVDLTA